MIDLVLVKKDILCYVLDVKAIRGMGRVLSYHHVVLCKVRLVVAWIKRGKVVNETRRIGSEKFREHQYMIGYDSCLKSKKVEWN